MLRPSNKYSTQIQSRKRTPTGKAIALPERFFRVLLPFAIFAGYGAKEPWDCWKISRNGGIISYWEDDPAVSRVQ